MKKRYTVVALIVITLCTIVSLKLIILDSILDLKLTLSRFGFPTRLTSSGAIIGSYNSCYYQQTGRTATDGLWYNFSTPVVQFYAFSAFYYDTDPLSTSKPVVRIIAITSTTVQMKNIVFGENNNKLNLSKVYKLVCILHFKNYSRIIPVNDKWMDVGYGYKVNGEWVRERIYTCNLDSKDDTPPLAVTIAPADNVTWIAAAADNRQTCMPVEVPPKPSDKKDFCVCGPASYGHVDPHQLTEWMEMQRLLGVNLVVAYDFSLSELSKNALQRYVLEGFLDLRETDAFDYTQSKHYLLHSTPAINDCMYRNMYSCNHIVVVDFDELIVPISPNQTTLRELIDALHISFSETDSPLPPASYAFRNNYFFTDLLPDLNQSAISTYLRYRKSVATSPEGYSSKSIHNPLACSHAHNHYCWGTNDAYKSRRQYQEVDAQYALNFHYKKCHFTAEECEEMMQNITQLDTMLKYKTPLLLTIVRK